MNRGRLLHLTFHNYVKIHGELLKVSESESVGMSSEAPFQLSMYHQKMSTSSRTRDKPEVASSTSEMVKTSRAVNTASNRSAVCSCTLKKSDQSHSQPQSLVADLPRVCNMYSDSVGSLA